MIIHRRILGNAECEGGLTHGRTSGDDDEVGILPSGSHLVHTVITGRNTSQTSLVLRSPLQDIHGILDDRINLCIILLHVVLRNLEEFTFRLLHQFIHVHAHVERLGLDATGKMNELSLQISLRQDSGMRLDMGSRSHLGRNLHQIGRSAYSVQFAHLRQLISKCHDIHRALLHIHGLDSLVNLLVARLIEGIGFQHLGNHGEGVRIHHEGTQHHFLHIYRLRLKMRIIIIYRSLLPLFIVTYIIIRHYRSFHHV